MQKYFTKILVPLALNCNSRWSVDKAVQLANRFNADIFLLHVVSESIFSVLNKKEFSSLDKKGAAEEKIRELENHCKTKLNDGLLVNAEVVVGNWHAEIKDFIIANHIDLLLVPRNRRRIRSAVIKKININKLSQQTNCPILTVTRNFNSGHLQNIVVPVNDSLPFTKLSVASYISRELNGMIYLMTEYHGKNTASQNNLMRAYQLLTDFGKFNIQCALAGEDDMASSTLVYAKNIKADLIVINTGKESRLTGWWNKLRGKYLARESEIPILTVSF
jgi:nucleotide-binding universal stress UspA family protein